jgi:hypothetical protein
MTRGGGLPAMLLVVALFTASCKGPPTPPNRSGFYNLVATATVRDFPAERRYDCQISFELDMHVPLPDTFTTVADAHVRRSVGWNAGGEVAEDSIVRGVVIRLERLRRTDPVPLLTDSVQITLGGGITDTLHGLGTGGSEGWYDGAWSCASTIPPHPRLGLREAGYPPAELEPGEWHMFPFYAGD